MGKSKIGNRKSAIQNLGPALRFDFSPRDPAPAIAEVILKHQGADQAITIEGIAQVLWDDEWWFTKNDSKGHPIYPYREKLRRLVKKCVAQLCAVEDGRKETIVSSRGGTPGYFVATSKDEVDKAARTFIRQAVQMLKRARKLTGNSRYEELAGQLVLLAGGAAEVGEPAPEAL